MTNMARKRRGRNEGSIFQRADGLWVAKLSLGYGPDGKRQRKTVYGKSKADVQEALRRLQAKGVRALRDSCRWTVAKYLQHWLETVKPTVEPGTYRPYERHCALHIIPYLGNVALSKLDENHVEALYAELAGKGMSATMMRKVGTTLTIALERQVGRALDYNPAKKVPKPLATKPEFAVLDPDQIAAFLRAAEGDRLFPLYLFLLDSGARPGEALALDWADFDFDAGHVTINKSLEEIAGHHRVKATKTKKSNRRIALSQRTLTALQEHRRQALALGFIASPVFHNSTGGFVRLHELHKFSFKPILRRAGLPCIRLYDLRHSCATLLLLADANPKIVSERLGHSSITLTLDTYSHVLPTMQQRAAEVMDRLLSSRRAVNE
jgi:integrase